MSVRPRIIINVCCLTHLSRFNGLRHSCCLRSVVFRGRRVRHVLDFRHLNIFIDSYRTYMLTSVVLISRNACQLTPCCRDRGEKSIAASPLESALTGQHRVLACFSRNHPLVNPLECALTRNRSASPLECALTKKQGVGALKPYPTFGNTSATSTSTATDRWISSRETTTRRLLFFRFRIPSSPANGPPVIRTRRPTVKNGCGSARKL